MSRSEQVMKVLSNLSATTPDVEAAAVVDNDGLMIASVLASHIDGGRVAAISAALLGLGEQIVEVLGRGELSLLIIRGTVGYALLVRCGPETVLMVLATEAVRLGLIVLDVNRAAKDIHRLLA